MNKSIFLIFLFFLLMGCEDDETLTRAEKQSKLIVNWSNPSSYSIYNSTEIHLYDSEEEYKKLLGSPLYSKSRRNLSSTGYTYLDLISFDNLPSQKYWIKIFNADRWNRLIEHNQNSSFTLEYPLTENATTVVTIETQQVYVRSCTIQKIEIYDSQDWIDSSIGSRVRISFLGPSDVSLDAKLITVDNSFISYEPSNITISGFLNYTHKVSLRNTNSLTTKQYEIDIFGLLNSNAYFGNEYIKLNDQNEIQYKLYVTWND